MPTVRISVLVEVDDVPIANFPLFFRAQPAVVQPSARAQQTGGSLEELPSGLMAAITTAILSCDGPVGVAVAGSGTITLTAGSILLLAGTNVVGGIQTQNLGAAPVNLRAFLAGTAP